MERLDKQGCKRILMFPLYPQYSATTTATVNDKFFEALIKMRFMPATRTVPPIKTKPSISMPSLPPSKSTTRPLDFEPEVLIASYHGIPQSYFKRGDPYPCHCWKTTRLLRERLGWDESKLITCFQSRFGPEKDAALRGQDIGETRPGKASNPLLSSNPGFVSDYLETLEE